MAYQDEVKQTQLSVFAELYDIIFPDFTLYLTPYPQEITYATNTYTPCVMERTEITKEKGEEKVVTISFATKENVTFQFLNYNIPRIKVKITRYFIEKDVGKVIFVGEGEIVGISNRILTFRAVDILSLNKAIVPPLVYSSYCNNTLFDSRCGLNRGEYKVETTVAVVNNGSALQSSTFGDYEEDYFTYGYVEYNKEYRMITKHDKTNNLVYLHAPFDQDVDGKVVTVYPGCDKTPQTCKNRFNNLKNFLGFPYIPSKNPTIWGI